MPGYPDEVQQLHDSLIDVPGVAAVELGIQSLAGIGIQDLSLPGEFGDLPHVAIRRTDGGRDNDLLVTATIRFAPERRGWVALELLAWWVRDLSRSGHTVQMRPLALPPVGYGVQLGKTLKFVIEWFFQDTGEIEPVLAEVAQLAASLRSNLEDYAEALKNPADPEKDLAEASTDALYAAAEAGDMEAQFELAQRYAGGGVEQSPEEAVAWYTRSAEQGYPPAMAHLGFHYAQGEGCEQDYRRAFELYQRAADAGLLRAMGLVGGCYEEGEGVERDLARAVQWYKIGAEGGDDLCQAQLGECYEQGKGVPADSRKALEWYEAALAQGFDAVIPAIERVQKQLP